MPPFPTSVAIRRNFARWRLSSFRLQDPIAVYVLASSGLVLGISDRGELTADSFVRRTISLTQDREIQRTVCASPNLGRAGHRPGSRRVDFVQAEPVANPGLKVLHDGDQAHVFRLYIAKLPPRGQNPPFGAILIVRWSLAGREQRSLAKDSRRR